MSDKSNKTVVLLTTGQPSSNPRLVKEANALSQAGYNTWVLYSYWADWAQKNDQELLKSVRWQAIKVGGDPEHRKYLWLKTRLRRKIAAYFKAWLPCAERALCRSYDELRKKAAQIKADLYIAHNLGALPVAARVAQKCQVPYSFDAEDYHRGESVLGSPQSLLVKRIEETYFPDAAYLSTASPLIAATYQKHFAGLQFHVINNVFSKQQQPPFDNLNNQDGLKLFWFSQTVGTNRGLQEVIEAMNLLPENRLTLSLVGQYTEEIVPYFRSLLSSENHKIDFIGSLPEDELIRLASQHHIGLALERNEPHNRRICLTNKIFTYLLAGNVIIASETDAQKQFIVQHPEVGKSYPIGNPGKLAAILSHYHNAPVDLLETRQSAWDLAFQTYNWEVEQKQFMNLVKSVV